MSSREVRTVLIRFLLGGAAAFVVLYGLLAYVVLPWAWTHYEHQRGLEGLPMVTRTAQGIPGDPLNVGLVGSRDDIVHAMHAAGWFPADPITLRTSIEIIGSVLLNHPYPEAPVSDLFYNGRRQDLAYEKPVGPSANRRNHVRLWKVLTAGTEDRPVWLGSATFDTGVGLSRFTGQFTHRISPDVDSERDLLTKDLERAGMVEATYAVSGVGPTLFGRNGEGDPYHTDGEISVSVLVSEGKVRREPPMKLLSPPIADLKNRIFQATVRGR
jgi:hypothetical protein